MEQKKYVEILHYQVTMKCDKCGQGDMEVIESNTFLATDPPRYAHKCTSCENVETYTKRYPYIEERILHIPQK